MIAFKTTMIAAAAMSIVGSGVSAQPTPIPQTGISRADLQRHDLDIAGQEAIQVRVDFAPGAVAARHRHPGEEIVYVLKGALEYRLEGKPPVVLNPGDVIFIPTGTVHEVKNVGEGSASELATYVVEKGKPLVVLVQ